MLLTIDGIVIGRRAVGDSNCFLDILTDEYGVIEVTAHGVKKLTSRNAAVSALYSYASFCLNKTGTRYSLNSAEPKYSFHAISSQIEYLSLASYFSQVIKDSVAAEQPAKGFVRFMAVSLFELDKKRVDITLIKSVFELRTAAMLGFTPDLRGCSVCGKYENKSMYFDFTESKLFCGDCLSVSKSAQIPDNIRLTPEVLYCLRHTVYSDTDKIYKLSPSPAAVSMLSMITEKYLLGCLERSFDSLVYYKNIIKSL